MSGLRLRLAIVVGALVALAGAGNAFAAGGVVISQVYGGGGNSGATLTHDFIELHNRTAAAVDLTGWSVQYAASTGVNWQRTPLAGTIAPGGYYLIQQAQGAGGTTPLPTPDATGTIAMSGTAGKVVLIANNTTITSGTSCPAVADYVDLVGYGSATNCFETAPTANLSNTTAALRNGAGSVDTDSNAADFTIGAPNPRNSGGEPPPPPPPATELEIGEIQGSSHTSPFSGEKVSTTGIVTATRIAGGRGFYLQDPTPDANSSTSEGIFVFTSVAPLVSVGDSVEVTGTVSEFGSGSNLTITQITAANADVSSMSSGNTLPPATTIGTGGLFPPTETIDDDSFATFDPTNDAIDFYESLEGMLVKLNAGSAVVGPTKSFGEFVALPDGGSWTTGLRTPRGGILYSYADPNPERLAIDDEILRDQIVPRPSKAMPDVNVGDVITSALVGPLDYTFANYKIQATSTPTFAAGSLEPEVTRAPLDQEIAVATFNVENLDPSDGPTIGRLAAQVVDNLRSPDLIGIEEVQDNSGGTNDGTVDASQSWGLLIAAIQAAGGPLYEYRQIDPLNNQDGGQPGGNIRVGFLFRTDRGLSFIDRPGGDAVTPVAVVDHPSGPRLSISPGRLDPAHPGFVDTRKSLAGEFRFRGKKLFVVVNHFSSKGDDQPLFGRFQPPTRFSEVARHQQAQVVNDFVDDLVSADAKANVIVLGDINDFEFSETVDILEGGVLTTLMDTLPANERYSYVFEGNSQVLDQILVSDYMLDRFPLEYDVVHVNAEFADQASDHDPQVARINLIGTS